MGSVPEKNGCFGNKGLVEINHRMWDGHKEVRNGVAGEGQDLSQEDESRINEIPGDVKVGCQGAVQAQTDLQKPLQPPQGPVVRWERFLPLRSLKVLLVENDDSTRHVVSALLRNCSYEVIAAANGLQAWKLLEDLTNHIDLVLTEVFIPRLSGVGLLCKIMSHETCSNIPVIMMSSHDSMGIVFSCLSKGAVDFLVKPIRKNELKNLWQHVWRRCHSSSGSGSESGIQTQKSAKSQSVEESDNDTGSNDEDDNGSIGLNVRDGSDNGSGTQSSWTKRAVEVDSPQPMLPWDQLADPPNSTCAQVTHTKPEAFSNEWVPTSETRELQEQDEQLDNVAMGKDLEIGISRNSDTQVVFPCKKVSTKLTGTKHDKLSELDANKDCEPLDKVLFEINNEKPIGKLKAQAADLINVITNSTDLQMDNRDTEFPSALSKIAEIKGKDISDFEELPSLELSLKRQREVGDVTTAHDERNVLRHSDLSAFSRYNTSSTTNQAPIGNVGSCSLPHDNSSEAVKTESLNNFAAQSNGNPPNQQSNGSSDNNDMGSTTKNIFTKPAVINMKSASTSAAKCLYPSSGFQPVQNGRISQKIAHEKVSDGAVNEVLGQPKGTQQEVQVQHHHHHYHHYHHHLHNMQQPSPDHNDSSLKNLAADTQQCGSSSNVFGGQIEGKTLNYSLNGSASGSNYGSSTVVNTGGIIENDNGVTGKGGACGVIGSGNGVEQNRFAQREAALTKFRQKRKERCFEKKVRYHSRKKLAEQRPRVRGQFVRQILHGHENQDADC